MLTINIHKKLQKKLEKKAKENGRTLEDEINHILSQYLNDNQPKSLNLADSIKQRFGHLDNINIPEIDRDSMRSIPDFNL